MEPPQSSPRTIVPALVLFSKCASFVTATTPSRAAVEAIQMSLVGSVVPTRPRSATISAEWRLTSPST